MKRYYVFYLDRQANVKLYHRWSGDYFDTPAEALAFAERILADGLSQDDNGNTVWPVRAWVQEIYVKE